LTFDLIKQSRINGNTIENSNKNTIYDKNGLIKETKNLHYKISIGDTRAT